jgi:outer membrane protein OmpA-like peptidoglycan-associated protein
MAHLEVKPKPSRPWWIWALAVILIVALAAMVFDQCTGKQGESHASTDGTDTASMDTAGQHKAVAATSPDWENVDFNSQRTNDADITAADIYTQTNGNYTIYSLGENLLFDAESSNISSNGATKLKMVAQVLQKRFKDATIGVFGNTDSTGTAAENKKIGMLRAQAVKEWLATQGNIPSQNLSVRSLGETQPVASNQTAEGRKQNRNVAIVVFPKTSTTTHQ